MWSLLFKAGGHILCCIAVGLLAKTYWDDQMIFIVRAYSMLFNLNLLNFNNMSNKRPFKEDTVNMIVFATFFG